MSWFQLDPESQAARLRESGTAAPPPTAAACALRGAVGFTWVSVAGFAPWAIGGRFLHRQVGEAGMYAACALVFLGLSGLALHRLILGPGSLSRFHKLFTAAFTVYSVIWIAGWMGLGGHLGGALGLLGGTAAMGWMFCEAFDCREARGRVILLLFALNAAGYFGGGWVEAGVAGWKDLGFGGTPWSRGARMTLAMLLWGVCYGIGFGAGLGLAFHACQARVRQLAWPQSAGRTHQTS